MPKADPRLHALHAQAKRRIRWRPRAKPTEDDSQRPARKRRRKKTTTTTKRKP